MDKVRILIVDDHKIFRQGLGELLLKKPRYEIVGEAGNGREAVDMVAKVKPDIIFLDISMPELNGIDAISQIRKMWPSGKIIMLSMYDKSKFVCESLKQGVAAYLMKDISAEELYKAIEIVLKGEIYLCEKINQQVVQSYVNLSREREFISPIDSLSGREREVLQLIAEGCSSKEIAGKLNISPKTVEHHRGKIMNKLKCQNAYELIRIALKEDIITK